MTTNTALEALCEDEFKSLKERFRGDEILLKQAIESMGVQGYDNPNDEIPDISDLAEKLINKWRGDSRSSGLELAMVNVWNRAKRLALRQVKPNL